MPAPQSLLTKAPHPLSERFLGPAKTFRQMDVQSVAKADERRLAGAPFQAPMANASPAYMEAMNSVERDRANAPTSILGHLTHIPTWLGMASSYLGLPGYQPTSVPNRAWSQSFKGLGAHPAFAQAEAQERFQGLGQGQQLGGNAALMQQLPMLMQAMQQR